MPAGEVPKRQNTATKFYDNVFEAKGQIAKVLAMNDSAPSSAPSSPELSSRNSSASTISSGAQSPVSPPLDLTVADRFVFVQGGRLTHAADWAGLVALPPVREYLGELVS